MNNHKNAGSMNTRYKIRNTIIILLIAMTGSLGCKNNDTGTASQQRTPSFDSLRSVHDSLVSQYTAANGQIDQLSSKAAALDSAARLKDAEIARLKGQVAKLGKKNKTLSRKLKKDEKFVASIKDELNQKERSYAEKIGLLQTEKDKLSAELADLMKKFDALKQLGSVLHASNIQMEALHMKHSGKERHTRRARKLNVLRVHFDIDENRIADDGTKQLYIAVTAPDGKVLEGKGNNSGSFTASDGKVIEYSVLKEISLRQNEPVKGVTADWKQSGDHESGTYNVAIYNGGYKIGGGSVALK